MLSRNCYWFNQIRCCYWNKIIISILQSVSYSKLGNIVGHTYLGSMILISISVSINVYNRRRVWSMNSWDWWMNTVSLMNSISWHYSLWRLSNKLECNHSLHYRYPTWSKTLELHSSNVLNTYSSIKLWRYYNLNSMLTSTYYLSY